MPRAKRICSEPGCPIITATTLCPTHQAQAEKARGSREQRGYGHEHRTLRKQWASKVATGSITCARCGDTIHPGTTWALDHSDDRATYLGPSHTHCNNSAGGKASQGRR